MAEQHKHVEVDQETLDAWSADLSPAERCTLGSGSPLELYLNWAKALGWRLCGMAHIERPNLGASAWNLLLYGEGGEPFPNERFTPHDCTRTSLMRKMKGLSIGRAVHFNLPNGEVRLGIVTRVVDKANGRICLRAMVNDGVDPFSTSYDEITDQPCVANFDDSKEAKPMTWHWPSRVD